MTVYTGLSIDQATNDLHLDATGNLAMVEDAECVAQHVRQRLESYQGEWFLDTTAGVPWLQDILGNRYDAALAEAVVKSEIVGTVGVTGISSFSVGFDRSSRGISAYNITVETQFDEEVRV